MCDSQVFGQAWLGDFDGMHFVNFDFSHRHGFAPWRLRIDLMCAGASAVCAFVVDAQLATGFPQGSDCLSMRPFPLGQGVQAGVEARVVGLWCGSVSGVTGQ